jgi:hypothetical protein
VALAVRGFASRHLPSRLLDLAPKPGRMLAL